MASMGISTEDVADLGAGTYTVVATDENGCTVSTTVVILQKQIR